MIQLVSGKGVAISRCPLYSMPVIDRLDWSCFIYYYSLFYLDQCFKHKNQSTDLQFKSVNWFLCLQRKQKQQNKNKIISEKVRDSLQILLPNCAKLTSLFKIDLYHKLDILESKQRK